MSTTTGPSIVTLTTSSTTTSLITGSTWYPESAFDAFTATSLTSTVLPNTTCPGPASPTHGRWLPPDNSITLEPLNQTTLDYALSCCERGVYYFIDPQCSDAISGSGLFCQPVEESLGELSSCFKSGTKLRNGIGGFICEGDEDECSQAGPIRSVSVIVVTTGDSSGKTTALPNSSSLTAARPQQTTTSTTSNTISDPTTAVGSSSSPVISQAAAPVLVYGDGPAGLSKLVVSIGVIWLVGMFAAAI